MFGWVSFNRRFSGDAISAKLGTYSLKTFCMPRKDLSSMRLVGSLSLQIDSAVCVTQALNL